jgi:hypothetical protein
MSAFMHSAVGFGTPDTPPPGLGSTIGPISLHNAIVELFMARVAQRNAHSKGATCLLSLRDAL